MGLASSTASRAITNADHAPATSARSRLPPPLERVIALPFKEGEANGDGGDGAMPLPPYLIQGKRECGRKLKP
jgi:hypothetical protein